MFESRNPDIASPAPYPRWLGDIGGTNARFGWQASESAAISHVQVLPCAEHESLLEAAQSYLREQGLSTPPCAAFGIANPVTGDQVAMTNHHWKFSVSALRESLGLARFLLLNDFTALALSLPQLPEAHRRAVGGGQAAPDAAIGLIGAGTGLGVSGLLPLGHQNKWIPIAGEGGHVTLSAATALEFAAIQHLQKRYGHVSAERVISGAGLVDLYHALCDLKDGQGREITTPADVMARAQDVPLSTANQALDMFCGFLGSVAGDLALTLGARGGIYIGGGIVPRMGERFEASPFRARFEDKGRFKPYLQAIPTWVIHSPVSPALQGASQALSLTQW
ncbi:glucokinase [Polaromonas naphthalenivorans]|uniref:Glucokinase n=1 Tax=Polaromonas naphthalenivorans (strain CJ2) TaxID=365044 RepID=A1VTL3_POLNA|nr:glucokinase [Polaromonas naphthalenivorans]ABM38991.1 glucokinase [Polaromonas naphthalenivorans CJ2]